MDDRHRRTEQSEQGMKPEPISNSAMAPGPPERGPAELEGRLFEAAGDIHPDAWSSEAGVDTETLLARANHERYDTERARSRTRRETAGYP
jgi:hypothetical protein